MTAQSWKSALTDVDSTAQETLGTIREDDNKRYKYVQFSGTTAIDAGDFLCYLTYASNALLQIVDGANGGSLVGAGVALATVASGAVAFGWIQISGVAVLEEALAGSPSIGDALTHDGQAAGVLATVSDADSQTVAICVDATSKTVVLCCTN
jgi:hypothetical protein